MKAETLINTLGIVGLLLTPSAIIEGINPYIRYPAFIFGIFAIGFYIKLYYDEKNNTINRTK